MGWLFGHNGVKLEIYSRRKSEKSINNWKSKETLLKNHWIKEKITRPIRKYFEMQTLCCAATLCLWEIHSCIYAHYIRRLQFDKPTLLFEKQKKSKLKPKQAEGRK